MAFRGKPRLLVMALYVGCLTSQTFLILADEIRWYRVLFVAVAAIGIYLECFVEDPRRES